jgi:hypothetical protein
MRCDMMAMAAVIVEAGNRLAYLLLANTAETAN